tara:strand:+ start:1331 stop:1555 length:225 start_codon:yes stop_codon:yes gene_type:complete
MSKGEISDNCYNLINQLTKKLQAVWAYDKLIKDARKCKDRECERLLKKIRDDDKRHVKMLQDVVAKLARKGKLK